MKSSQTIAQKWARSMQNASAAVKEGIASVTVAPGETAASRADLYRRKVNEAVDSGRFADGCRSVSLQQWKDAFLKKGVDRISTGATAAQSKVEAFHAWHQPIAEASSAECQAMPKGGPEDSKARMLRNFENMSRNKYKGRGR